MIWLVLVTVENIIILETIRKNNVFLQCHAITSKLYSCSDLLLLTKFIKLRRASIMASTVSLHTPVSILLSITLITFIGRPTVSVKAAKNH